MPGRVRSHESGGAAPRQAASDRRVRMRLIASIDTIRRMTGIERVTRQLLDLLTALLEAHLRGEELHGYGLMKRTGLSGPSTYRGLDRLEDACLVDARWEELPPGDERPRRCYYRLNPSGVEVARKLLAERRPDALARLGQASPRLAPAPRPGLSTIFRGLLLLERTVG